MRRQLKEAGVPPESEKGQRAAEEYWGLVLKLADGEKEMIFRDEYPFIRRQSDRLSFEALNDIFLEIEHARARLRANVNYDTVLEVLLMFVRDKCGDGGNSWQK